MLAGAYEYVTEGISRVRILSYSPRPPQFLSLRVNSLRRTIDDHHTTEDTFFALGAAFSAALRTRTGLACFSSAYVSLDRLYRASSLTYPTARFISANYPLRIQRLVA